MKTIIKCITWTALALPLGCDSDDGGPAITTDEASRIAQDAVGGAPGEVERSMEGDVDVWEVYVAMDNGATLEVKVDVEAGDIVVVEDKTGPFDYPDFTPVPGALSFDAITAKALENVAGTVEAWEIKRESAAPGADYEYEFYVRDADAQLWEIKFEADTGVATEVEAKDEVDP